MSHAKWKQRNGMQIRVEYCPRRCYWDHWNKLLSCSYRNEMPFSNDMHLITGPKFRSSTYSGQKVHFQLKFTVRVRH
uniref:N-carbamoylputrescine amidase isoform X2 n=1 Tax=Rhizophora mucronata TaxID=61149 RepID=A0A2P2LN00_RHIMU